ncbi:DNA phosphorothioation-dependent restriction protein DptF [Viridibacillus arvi]|uniref:DNA phosphorothioation-dependent restriction protein DptF n=1 Tax=Viridibacillus arvi TaxID=263475 RepID=UPI003CFC5998
MKQFKEPQFINQIKMLQSSSIETVVHANSFAAFPKYMHTERPIEGEVIKAIEQLNMYPVKQLILLCGSVGDGKSHLLSFLKVKYPDVFQHIKVHNDATESYDPSHSSIETLEKVLQEFNDNQVAEKHVIVAINMGVLHNFCQKQAEQQQFVALRKFIEKSGVFDKKTTDVQTYSQFQMYNFASERIFLVNENGAHSPFLSEILSKIMADHEGNPIYSAWKQDMAEGNYTMAHLNYQLLQNETIQHRVLEKLYHVMIRDKVILSTRAFYHFIFTLIMPTTQEMDSSKTSFGIEHTLPNLLFNRPERSTLLEHIHQIDPLNIRYRDTDERIMNFHILTDKWGYIENQLQLYESTETEKGSVTEIYINILKNSIADKDILELSKFIVRMKDLLEPTIYTTYHEFLGYLYSYYRGEAKDLAQLFSILKDAFVKWKGSPKKDYYFVTNDVTRAYRTALPLKLKENVGTDFGLMKGMEEISQFENYLTIGYGKYLFELDLHLYELLKQVQGGYRPNAAELNSAIQFEDFYKQLISQSEEESEELLIVRTKDQVQYVVSKPGFSFNGAKFEVEKVK